MTTVADMEDGKEGMNATHDRIDRCTVSQTDRGRRLDIFLAALHPDLSRSQIKRAVEEGRATVNGASVKAGYCLREGDRVDFRIAPPREWGVEAENIALSVVFEDESLIVIDKPPGIVVHPGAGNYHGTLVNALLFHCRDLSGIGGYLRPGIVHRLDKNTSGLMVIAKSDPIHRALARQFKDRTVTKRYQAVVDGIMNDTEGTIDDPIGRHRKDRKKMSTTSSRGRQALTRWRVVKTFGRIASLLDVRIETGRTHQIRVHMNALGHPVLGDPEYGSRGPGQGGLRHVLKILNRQALHAATLGFYHPRREEFMEFSAPLPDDLTRVLDELEKMTAGMKGNGGT